MDDSNEKTANSADALEDLAEESPGDVEGALAAAGKTRDVHAEDALATVHSPDAVDAEDALASLASGESDEADEADEADEVSGEDRVEGPVEAGAAAYDLADATEPASGPVERRSRRSAQARSAALVHSVNFKKTMVPLLLVVGVLLLVLSAATAAMLLFPGGEGDPGALGRHGPALILASCPLAAILLAGAWMFHLEVRRAERKEPSPSGREPDERRPA